MNFSGFERPTEKYNEHVKEIDEQICALIAKRKELSNDDPGFPPQSYIEQWAQQYHLYEDFLNGLFGHLQAEEMFQPRIEPQEFVGNMPILQSIEKNDLFYTITYLRQYKNASVIHLIIDLDTFSHDSSELHDQTFFHHNIDLIVTDQYGTKYHAMNHSGSGVEQHMAFQYIISPALPVDSSPISLAFKDVQSEQVIEFNIQLT